MSGPRDGARPGRRRQRRAKRRVQRAIADPGPTAAAALSTLTHQRRLALAGSTTVVGLALVGIGESLAGSLVVLAGLVALMFSIHKYGRLGVERAPRG
jgi:hypothetical protein